MLQRLIRRQVSACWLNRISPHSAEASQRHQAYLTDHLVPSSPAYEAALQHATALLGAQGVPHALAPSQAIGLIAQTVAREATMLAYIDVFWGFALLAGVLVPVAFLLLRPAKAAAPAH